jgi:hypothetical protein
VALIRQNNAQQELGLHKRDDGQWFVELRIVRIIGTKGSDCGRDSDEDKT